MSDFKLPSHPRNAALSACLTVLVLLIAPLTSGSALGEEWPPAPPVNGPPETDAGELPSSVAARSQAPGEWVCTFTFTPDRRVDSVHLAGSFNGWAETATPLSDPEKDGVWSGNVTLRPGTYSYKFIMNGDQWVPDPENPDGEHDGHGGHNSIIRLGRLAHLDRSRAHVGDGKVDGIGLEHRPDLPLYFSPLSETKALLRYRTLANDVQAVLAAVKGAGLTEMYPVSDGPVFTIYEAAVDLPPVASNGSQFRQSFEYTFVLQDGQARVRDPELYTASFSDGRIFKTPEWARHAIWYQVFPDRFRNGDKANDPQPTRPWTSEWFTPSPWEEKYGQSFYKFYVFSRNYGGDFAGLEEKLPYLKDLGVNAIYLNPVFKAESPHKYNATNFIHIDDHFGTAGDYDAVVEGENLLDPSTWKWTESDKRFLAFLKKAKEMGFHVIIDGVFNHVGTRHPAFHDVRKNGQTSPYADWFSISSWEPFTYQGWAGFGELPAFKKSATGLASESLKKHIWDVTRRWMDPDGDGNPSDGIDGWRLDVPNELPAPFWVEWRSLVKSINPDAYISGEIWDQADEWLDGRHFDAVMNYQFARAVVAWVGNQRYRTPPSELDRRLAELRLAYPAAATYVLQNLLDSHDTDRIASMMRNPDRDYDRMNRVQDDNPNYDNGKPSAEEYTRARLAVLLAMTYVGAPMVYYGDEVGMWGADDPTCRKPMLWEDLQPYEKAEENVVMKDQLEFYKKVIRLRNEHEALRTGAFLTLLTEDNYNIWAYLRSNPSERLVVVLNASDVPREVSIPLPSGSPADWKVVFGDGDTIKSADNTVKLTAPAYGGVVLHATTK